MKCERCKKDIPLQYGFDTNSLVLKPRTNRGIIITTLCDECATNISSVIDNWLNKEGGRDEVKAYFDGEAYGWDEGRKDVLDKIQADIEALPKTYPFVNHIDMYVKEDDVKKIIDKYKESEE